MVTCLEQLQRWLREQHIPFSIQHHRQAFTLPEVAVEVHEPAEHVAKVVIAQVDDRLVMLVVPTPEHVDFKRVAKLLHAQSAVAAQEDEFQSRFPDCESGAMPPFGNRYDMPTYIDEALTRTSTLVFQAGTHRDTLKLATEDYLRLAKPVRASLVRVHTGIPSTAHFTRA
jgi:Ala-tRNA(Pro) deacylase